jgi:hypothetical protein
MTHHPDPQPDEQPELPSGWQPDQCVATAFRHERSVRRALKVLEVKHRRMQHDLDQFIQHITLLVPTATSTPDNEIILKDVLRDALQRLGDEAFMTLMMQALEQYQGDRPPGSRDRRAS